MPEVTNSGASTTQSDSSTGTTQADVAAAVRAAAAAAQTAATQAAAAANAAQAAASSFTQQEAVSDISQAEAYIVNLKNVVEQSLAVDHRIVHNALTFDEQMKQIALQNLQLGQTALQNAVALANRVNQGSVDSDVRAKGNDETQDKQMDACSTSERERTVRHGDLAIDRQWNVDEVAELVAKTPVFQDAIAGAVAKGVADAMSKK